MTTPVSPELSVPERVLDAYGLKPDTLALVPSLINLTYTAMTEEGASLILQRLHPIFAPEVNLNILHVTQRLKHRGLPTPELVTTRDGAFWVEHETSTWRAQTYVQGLVLPHVTDAEVAFHAGKLVATFHAALWDWSCPWQGLRSHVHDTTRHLSKLDHVLNIASSADDAEIVGLGAALVAAAKEAVARFDGLPLRTCHGDLKISNLLFHAPGDGYPKGRCLIDLDTLGPQVIAYELGDALRSWCNDASEDAEHVTFRSDFFQAACEGYLSHAPQGLGADEVDSILPGLVTVCLELATRFCVDAFEDSYFGWDPARYASRRAHNLARAKNQLSLALSVQRELSHLGPWLQRARQCFAP